MILSLLQKFCFWIKLICHVCGWNGCVKWRSIDEGRGCGVNYWMEKALGEHGGWGDAQDLTKKESKWNGRKLEGRRTGILTWIRRSCTFGQLAVSCRLTKMSFLVDRQPTEPSSVPLPEACFVTGNRQSAGGQPTCTISVDRQPTERSSVPLPEACFVTGNRWSAVG